MVSTLRFGRVGGDGGGGGGGGRGAEAGRARAAAGGGVYLTGSERQAPDAPAARCQCCPSSVPSARPEALVWSGVGWAAMEPSEPAHGRQSAHSPHRPSCAQTSESPFLRQVALAMGPSRLLCQPVPGRSCHMAWDRRPPPSTAALVAARRPSCCPPSLSPPHRLPASRICTSRPPLAPDALLGTTACCKRRQSC